MKTANRRKGEYKDEHHQTERNMVVAKTKIGEARNNREGRLAAKAQGTTLLLEMVRKRTRQILQLGRHSLYDGRRWRNRMKKKRKEIRNIPSLVVLYLTTFFPTLFRCWTSLFLFSSLLLFLPLWPSSPALPVATRPLLSFFFLPCLLLAFYKYILPSFSLFFILFILSFSYLASLLFSIRFLSYFLLFWNSQLYVTCAAARVFRGQCRRFLDWWLEGGRMEEEELGPLLTKDLQYTFGPSLERVYVCECASCCSFLSLGQKWSHHLLMIISQKFKFSYRSNKKLLDITLPNQCGYKIILNLENTIQVSWTWNLQW